MQTIDIEIIPLPDSDLKAYAIGYSDGLKVVEAIQALESAILIIQQGSFIEAKAKGFTGQNGSIPAALHHKETVLLETVLPHTIINLNDLTP